MAVPDYTIKAIQNYHNKKDIITVYAERGTKERIKALGLSANSFCLNAIIRALEEAEQLKMPNNCSL